MLQQALEVTSAANLRRRPQGKRAGSACARRSMSHKLPRCTYLQYSACVIVVVVVVTTTTTTTTIIIIIIIIIHTASQPLLTP